MNAFRVGVFALIASALVAGLYAFLFFLFRSWALPAVLIALALFISWLTLPSDAEMSGVLIHSLALWMDSTEQDDEAAATAL